MYHSGMGDSKKKHVPSPKVEPPKEEMPSPLDEMLTHEEMETTFPRSSSLTLSRENFRRTTRR